MNGRRTTVRECAQKDGKIDENSNEDKEEIDAKSYKSGYVDDDITNDDNDDGDEDDNNNNHFERVDEVMIMGTERQMPVSDVGETSAPKQASAVLNTITVTATIVTNTTSKVHGRFQCFRFCRLVYSYQRQINSVSSGFLLLMATGFQILWGLNQLYDHRGGNLPTMIFNMVAIYYVGAIVGTALSAFLISIVRKRTIHVCIWYFRQNSFQFHRFRTCRYQCWTRVYRFFTSFLSSLFLGYWCVRWIAELSLVSGV